MRHSLVHLLKVLPELLFHDFDNLRNGAFAIDTQPRCGSMIIKMNVKELIPVEPIDQLFYQTVPGSLLDQIYQSCIILLPIYIPHWNKFEKILLIIHLVSIE